MSDIADIKLDVDAHLWYLFEVIQIDIQGILTFQTSGYINENIPGTL
jgi:hypothetical protein